MRFVLIGNGSLAVECAWMAASSGMQPAAVATGSADLLDWAASVQAPAFSLDNKGFEKLESCDFDFLFSVNNPVILREGILSRARRHSVNFHDSPLPGYAGLNATSWALLNGEPVHGISWHLMERTVDSGDVLVERTFDVEESDSAYSLNLRCFEEALIGFGDVLNLLKTDCVKGRRQEQGRGEYFGAKDVPFGAGVIDFSEPASKIERMSRALEFGPSFNPLCTAKVVLEDLRWFSVGAARAIEGDDTLEEGVLGSLSVDSWIVGTTTGPILLQQFNTSDGEEIAADVAARDAGIGEGCRLPKNACDAGLLSKTTGELKRHEDFWRQRLLTSSRLESPLGLERKTDAVSQIDSFHVAELSSPEGNGTGEAAVIAAFAVVMADLFDVDRLDLGFEDSEISRSRGVCGAFFSSQVPLRVDLNHRHMADSNWEPHIQGEIDLCRKRVGFSKDLFVREPALSLRGGDLRVGVAFAESEDGQRTDPRFRHLVQLIGNRRRGGAIAWRLKMSERLDKTLRGGLEQRLREALRQLQSGVSPAKVIPIPLEEQQSILAVGTGPVREYPLDRTLGGLLKSAFDRNPESIAVMAGSSEISYGELDVRSTELAWGLVSRGHGHDGFIGITAERSIEQIVGLVAIAKVGSGFVAIDPDLPKNRQRLMAAATGLRLIVAQESCDAFDIPGTDICSFGELMIAGDPPPGQPFRPASSSDPAYVTFTSGSTGEPKGVCVRQRSLINFLFGAMEAVDLGSSDRRLQFSTLSFDVALEEVFCTFLSGATLVLRDDDCIGSTTRFTDFIEETGITVLDLPTAYFEIWVGGLSDSRRSLPSSLKTVVVGGQALRQKVADGWFGLDGSELISLYNCYGPAEATVAVTYVKLDPGFRPVPIGRPIPNTMAIPVGRRGNPRPVGMVGEILLGGECVTDGYLGRGDLTRERYQDVVFLRGEETKPRFFRTGDFGWYGPGGQLYFLGREDRQVKIRGYRVEIEEVESHLGNVEGVTSAAVFEDTGRLFGAVVSNCLGEEQIRSELASRVPDYMIPTKIIVRDHFETSPSGKINWDWLEAEFAKESSLGTASEQSAVHPVQNSLLETSVREVFAEALERKSVGLDDDFFGFGGDSLGVVRVLGDLESLTGLRVPMASFLDQPSPRGVAASIEALQKHRRHDRDGPPGNLEKPGGRVDGDGAPVFIITPLGNAASPIMRCMDWFHRPLRNLGIPFIGASGEPIGYRTIGEVATRLVGELRNLQPDCRRCSLVGFSFGGLVACEVARQLENQGVMPDGLVLIDPSYPRLDLSRFRTDPRVRAYEAGCYKGHLRPPAVRDTLRGRIRHAYSLLRERFAVRTRILWTRLGWELALRGGRWRRILSAREELAWFLREVRVIERQSLLQPFDLSAPVSIILASDSYRDDVELRWRLLVGDEAEIEMLECDHLGFFDRERNHLDGRLREAFGQIDRDRARI